MLQFLLGDANELVSYIDSFVLTVGIPCVSLQSYKIMSVFHN
jgi:hypothetical protein